MHSGTKSIAALIKRVLTSRWKAFPYIIDSHSGFKRKLINTVLITRAITTRFMESGFL